MMKQIAAQAIASALLLSLLSACGSSGTTEVQTTADTASQTTEAVTEAGPAFPAVSYGGEDIHFLTEEYGIYTSIEIFSPGLDGSLINDTVYNRNLIIEERFDVRITEERLQNAHTTAYTTVLSGEDVYDVVMPYLNNSVSNAVEGFYLDLYEVENLHLENSWWDQRANENLRVGGKLYFTTGDISILDNECTMVLLFNKQMAEQNDLPDPYAMVREGKWTMDALFEMCSDLSVDLNGDGKMKNTDDQYGIYCAFNMPHSLYFGTGERIAVADESGELQLVMYNERSAEVVNKIFDLCLGSDVMYGDGRDTAFKEGRLLMSSHAQSDIDAFRNCQFDFGILPYPKYNEEQKEYYSFVSTILTPGVSIPVTNNEPEKAGLILEAMAYYSVDTLTHAYYDITLNDRYIRDEDSGEMLDIIFSTRVYDFGFIFDVGGLGTLIETLYNTRRNNFASLYEKRESKAKAALSDLMDSFGDAQ
ncbi:MAG: hypothetical protein IKV66_02550 [Clostridia bacterium]|nr:hypothetical protein [Clostridia bacterium]